MGHPEKVIDFGYRAVHEMAVTGKAVIKAFYGRDAKHSYWNGCSAGGRQGLMSAQRYPEDFDAVVAGAPAINFTGRATQAVWIGQATHKDEASALPQAKFTVIHDAVLAACDAKDGVKDGVLEDPTKCKFDPKTLECSGADAPTCLTSAQVATVRTIYSDVINPRTKSVIFQGHEPGSENGWTTMAGANVFTIATDTFKYAVFENNNWDYKTLNFDADMATTLQKAGNVINALDPNLKPFISRGGKIIQYHGWSDPQISPRSSVEYYKSVAAAMGGASKINDNYRLFMVPGMAHCGGGDATANFDMLSALEQWVEQGKAPDRIEASRVRNGQTDRTRSEASAANVALDIGDEHGHAGGGQLLGHELEGLRLARAGRAGDQAVAVERGERDAHRRVAVDGAVQDAAPEVERGALGRVGGGDRLVEVGAHGARRLPGRARRILTRVRPKRVRTPR